jgi:hypothetical protein
MRMRRPFHALTCLGAVSHHAFELSAGVGLVFQPWLGLGGSGALWSVSLPAWWLAAARGSPAWDRPLALAAGLSLGGAAIHYLLWPWELRGGLPYLTEAEGLRSVNLPAYNAILWGWMAAAGTALLRETPRGARRWAILGVAGALPLRASARHHFVWVREQARTNPAWWNRAFAEVA